MRSLPCVDRWGHYSAAPRSEYGAELPTNGNAWAQLGQAHKRANDFGQAARWVFLPFAPIAVSPLVLRSLLFVSMPLTHPRQRRRFEEPFSDPFGTDSSFLNKVP